MKAALENKAASPRSVRRITTSSWKSSTGARGVFTWSPSEPPPLSIDGLQSKILSETRKAQQSIQVLPAKPDSADTVAAILAKRAASKRAARPTRAITGTTQASFRILSTTSTSIGTPAMELEMRSVGGESATLVMVTSPSGSPHPVVTRLSRREPAVGEIGKRDGETDE